MTKNGKEVALDLKSTYRKNHEAVSGFTLGAFTGYFRYRDSKKNIAFPYNEYDRHFILGIIYTQQAERIDENRVYTIDDLADILSVVKDFHFIVQEKYRIAKDRPGSGNTKNIGSCVRMRELQEGTGPFSALGVKVFDDYWMHYMTLEMARSAKLKRPPYTNLKEYLQYRNIKKPLAMRSTKQQTQLFDVRPTKTAGVLPSTRYQGSKHKILPWIDYYTKHLRFETVLDAFGGTGCVGYMYKKNGKQVFYNDALKFNYYVGLALIENRTTTLSREDVAGILKRDPVRTYPSFIYDTFHDIYFTDDENTWLDIIITNIAALQDTYKQALAYYALFQSCIIKRPYNLFHRKNLYIRTADVARSFGNKKTWDTPFEDHFLKFVEEANRAVFDNGKNNRVFHADIFDRAVPHADLVYIDTPYISANGIGVNYFDFYHFLEGIVFYGEWSRLIDEGSKHKKIKNGKNEWCNTGEIHGAFERLFNKFKDSILVVSYRDDGTPKISELVRLISKYKASITVKRLDHQYALSNRMSAEVLIIAQ